jgi:hypothetical protein
MMFLGRWITANRKEFRLKFGLEAGVPTSQTTAKLGDFLEVTTPA